MIALFVVGLGAVVAAVGTGVLVARSTQRPRIYLLAWAIALFGLAVGLGATTLGYLVGYRDLIFRAMELGTALIASLPLCVALVEMLGRSLPARFAMRLAASGLFVIAVVILGTDPISPDVTFNKRWPDPAVFYQMVPLAVLAFLALFTAVTVAASLVIAIVRSSRQQLARDEARPAMLVAAAALSLVLPELAWLLHKLAGVAPPLPAKDVFAASCALAACLASYAVKVAGSRDLGQAPSEGAVLGYRDMAWGDDLDELPSWRGAADEHPDRDGALGDRQPERSAHAYPEPGSDLRYPGLAALLGDAAEPLGEAQEHSDHQGQLFGQITIYTLAEGFTDDFDRLTEWVVTLVQAKEPDTLVYIVHAVPTAPLLRILYEVYRDRAAHDEHLRRSYVRTYETERRPLVVATNVIELGLQQAKVSPLPSISAISDILSESGIDLTGITRSSQPDGHRQAQGYHHPRPDAAGDFGYQGVPGNGHDPPEYDPRYQGWAGIRGEDSRY